MNEWTVDKFHRIEVEIVARLVANLESGTEAVGIADDRAAAGLIACRAQHFVDDGIEKQGSTHDNDRGREALHHAEKHAILRDGVAKREETQQGKHHNAVCFDDNGKGRETQADIVEARDFCLPPDDEIIKGDREESEHPQVVVDGDGVHHARG